MPTILLVEDIELNHKILSRRLRKRGYDVIVATDGEAGVKAASTLFPDLILMDLSLPVMDGWEATRRLKSDPRTQAIPVIALTAHAMSGDRGSAIEAGCDDFETKPIDLPRLLEKMKTNLERSAEETAAVPQTVGSMPEENPGAEPSTDIPELPAALDQEHSGNDKITILIVDDIAQNRELLARRLKKQSYCILLAENGRQALQVLEQNRVDLVLLDIMMPEMDGHQVLAEMQNDTVFCHIPVIVISASDEQESIIQCIENGAEDYLPKPCDPILLKARIKSSLRKKRLYDQEQQYRDQILEEKQRAERRLEALFPYPVIQELSADDQFAPRRYSDVAVLFCDIVGFTSYCGKHPAEEVVPHLQRLIEGFEQCADKYQLLKIKTIGDAFMATAGLLSKVDNSVLSCIKCGEAMIAKARDLPPHWGLRVGIHIGPVVAGVVGSRQYCFDLWGETVNTAARVESNGENGRINVSGVAWQSIAHLCRGTARQINVRGIDGPLDIVLFKEFRE